LQAAYSELRIAEADLVQATRLRNPGFSSRAITAATNARSKSRSRSTWWGS
jgi:hypothetical protein